MLHLEDIDLQYHRIPWLATYPSKGERGMTYPPLDKVEGMDTSRAFGPERGFPSCFSSTGEELLSWCFAAMIHCLKARRCYVMLLDKDRSELVVVKASAKGTPAPGDKIALSQSIAGWVVEHKQPLSSGNQGTKIPEAAAWNEEHDNDLWLAVPILGEEDVHGVLMAVNKVNGGTFSEHDLVTAEMLANHLALCIEESVLFEKGVEKRGSAPTPPMRKPV